jgi:hypothetical protein
VSIAVHAIQLADIGGGRPAAVNASQVQAWVDKANQVFSSAGVLFTFDDSVDFEQVENTFVNSMTFPNDPADPQSASRTQAASDIADNYPDKLVALFRFGPDPVTPRGDGFSGSDLNFVLMPGFTVTFVCAVQNIGLLAHEIGHYLGLPHTFDVAYASLQDAENAFLGSGQDPSIFDGEGLRDTLPDPVLI